MQLPISVATDLDRHHWKTRIGGVCRAVISLAFLVSRAQASISNVPCEEPQAFRAASVNAVVLPYSYVGSGSKPLSETARRLSLLVQLEILFSILKYDSIGAVHIVVRPEDQAKCAPEIVWQKLLGMRPGAKQMVSSGHGIVLVWGRLYEEGDQIYVQSYARFARRGMEETLRVRIGDYTLVGKLSSQGFAFAPQKLDVEDLAQIHQEFERSAVLHTSPTQASPGLSFGHPEAPPLAYWVGETKGEWIEVKSFGGTVGWIRAGTGLSAWPLRRKMPELSAVEGLVGYLSYRRKVEENPRRGSEEISRSAEQALERYREVSRKRSDTLAIAVGDELRAILRMTSRQSSAQDLLDAHRLLEEAVELVPYSADARNLLVIARLSLLNKSPGRKLQPRTTADDLLAALALEPQNDRVLANLESLYKLLLTVPPGDTDPADEIEPDEIRRRLEMLQTVRAAAARPAG